MQDGVIWPSLTEEEMTLLTLISRMQVKMGRKIRLAELEEEAGKAGLGIADHVLSCLNMLIADKGLAAWSDGEYSGENGERILTNSFVKLTECGKMISEIIIAKGQENILSLAVPISINMILEEKIGRVLETVKKTLSDPEKSDIPLYVSLPGERLQIDCGKGLINMDIFQIVDILRDAGYINVSPERIITMTESQMQMTYPPKK